MPTFVKAFCENCNQEFESLKKRKAIFCSKGCATSNRQKISDPDFMSLDDETRHYLLGLILTDGCISRQGEKQERMTLRTSDKQLAEHLHPLICPQRKLYANKPYKEQHNVSYALVSTNEDAIQTLKNYGVHPNKSHTVEYPSVPKDSAHHLIRGIFDGDGSIYINTVKGHTYKHVNFTTASFAFANMLKDELQNFGFHPTLTEDSRFGKYYVNLYRKQEVVDFGTWIYQDATHFLQRKQQAFMNDIV